MLYIKIFHFINNFKDVISIPIHQKKTVYFASVIVKMIHLVSTRQGDVPTDVRTIGLGNSVKVCRLSLSNDY